MALSKVFKTAGGILAIAGVVTLGIGITGYFAKAETVRRLSQQVTQHIKQNRVDWLDEKIYDIIDRCGRDATKMLPDTRDNYRRFTTERKRLLKEMEERK